MPNSSLKFYFQLLQCSHIQQILDKLSPNNIEKYMKVELVVS